MSDRNSALESAHFSAAPQIAGKTLRRLGPVSFVMLKRIGNLLACGGITTKKVGKKEAIDFEDEKNLTAVLEFIYIHSAPIEDVVRNVAAERSVFDTAVMLYTADISLQDLSKDSSEITDVISRASAALVEEKKSSEAGDPDPNAHGRRG